MNSMKKIDLSALTKAIGTLEEALIEYKKNAANTFVRDALIQRFKYTYELSHKMLKRFLEISEPNAETIDQMSFPTLIRTTSERGLVKNGWDIWQVYRNACNATSHTYNENKAIEVCVVIPDFASDVRFVLHELQKRITFL